MLQKQGLADVIISIDSDLLLYGAKQVLVKYDKYGKVGKLVTKEQVFQSTFSKID